MRPASISRFARTFAAVAALGMVMAGSAPAADTTLKEPTIGVDLPEKYNTPDGMTLDPQGNIILASPNFMGSSASGLASLRDIVAAPNQACRLSTAYRQGVRQRIYRADVEDFDLARTHPHDVASTPAQHGLGQWGDV